MSHLASRLQARAPARQQSAGPLQTNSAANQHGAPESKRHPRETIRRTQPPAPPRIRYQFAVLSGKKPAVKEESKNENRRDRTRTTQREHDLLNYQFGLPTVRRKHDGIPMLRQVPQKLARGMGAGNAHNEQI